MNWFPMLTLPMFVWMGYVMSETRMADDLYRMFHVWFGPVPGGLAVGTILLMVLVSAMVVLLARLHLAGAEPDQGDQEQPEERRGVGRGDLPPVGHQVGQRVARHAEVGEDRVIHPACRRNGTSATRSNGGPSRCCSCPAWRCCAGPARPMRPLSCS